MSAEAALTAVDYTGAEPSIKLVGVPAVAATDIFSAPAPAVPAGSVPIFDGDLKAVIGYRHQVVTGVYHLYDLDGAHIGMEEKGLESPAIDPFDFIGVGGVIARAFSKGVFRGVVRAAPKIAAATAGRVSAPLLWTAVSETMRMAFRRLVSRELKFTATTAARMMTRSRSVPVHILQLAIRHGTRGPDPQGVVGAAIYTIRMLRNGEEYLLTVVLREADWTVLHFLFK